MILSFVLKGIPAMGGFVSLDCRVLTQRLTTQRVPAGVCTLVMEHHGFSHASALVNAGLGSLLDLLMRLGTS